MLEQDNARIHGWLDFQPTNDTEVKRLSAAYRKMIEDLKREKK